MPQKKRGRPRKIQNSEACDQLAGNSPKMKAKVSAVIQLENGTVVSIKSNCYSDVKDIIDRLERKIIELETTKTISLQQAPQIRMLQANAVAMADKLQSTLYTVIPLWKNQIVIAFGTEHTRAAIAADKKLTDMSNQLLIKNAQNLKMLTIETQRARDDNNIDPKALGEANKILIESLDDISRIQQEGKLKRYQAEQELTKIDAEMKGRLLLASNNSSL